MNVGRALKKRNLRADTFPACSEEAPGLGEDCDPDGSLCADPNAECVDDGSGFVTCKCKDGYVEDQGVCREITF